MASLTKLMTALLTMENTSKDDLVRVEGPAPSVGESTINLQAGERLKVGDLLAAALIQSANDAAYALATDVGGSVKAFVRMMNERAAELGLEHTHYVVPDGLDTPGHYSSALDTYTLAREDMKHALFRRIVAQSGGEIAGGRTLYAWNDLLKTYPGAIGIKTGHTDLAGWSEIAAAERDGVTMYAVILGGPTPQPPKPRSRRAPRLGLRPVRARAGDLRKAKPYAEVAVPFSDDEVALVARGPRARHGPARSTRSWRRSSRPDYARPSVVAGRPGRRDRRLRRGQGRRAAAPRLERHGRRAEPPGAGALVRWAGARRGR